MSEPNDLDEPGREDASGHTATALLDAPQDARQEAPNTWRFPPTAGDTGGGGWGPWGGTAIWAPPPPHPSRPHPLRALAVASLVVAMVAASAVVGFALGHRGGAARPTAAASTSGGSSNSSGGAATGTAGANGSSNAITNASAITSEVDPGLVDVNTQLGYEDGAAAGTGMVLTSAGEVLTNNHVIEGATSISVTDIGNGRTYAATVVGTDATDDIAVLKMTGASRLATVNLGKSSTLAVGDGVVAIGNAGGVGGTPSYATGQVTALDQQIEASDEVSSSSEQLSGLVETNADLQPGDSGGPLVDAAGKVVGIDTAASSGFQLQPSSNQSFTIPIDSAISIAGQIEAGQASSTVHIGEAAFLGVDVTSPNSSEGSGTGAEVAGVEPGSPADEAGLSVGDVIDSLDRKTVSSPDSLATIMEGLHPGDSVELGWTDTSGSQHSADLQLAVGPPA